MNDSGIVLVYEDAIHWVIPNASPVKAFNLLTGESLKGERIKTPIDVLTVEEIDLAIRNFIKQKQV